MDLLQWLAEMSIVKITILAAAVVCAAGVGFSAWRRIRQSEHRTRLTAMMLERGMTPEQIEKVIAAGQIGQDPAPAVGAPSDPCADPEVRVIEHLTEWDYEADDVQKIVDTVRRHGQFDEVTVRIVETLASNWEDADAIVRLLEARAKRGPSPRAAGGPAGAAAAGVST